MDHIPVFKRVGWALVAVGVLDIGFMIYCMVNQMSYSSSFNIFAVIAGVLLIRGSLRTAQVVMWLSAFMFAGFLLGTLLVFPWVIPFDYWLRLLRITPWRIMSSIALVVVLLLFLAWVYHELRLPVVVGAWKDAGFRSGVPRFAFITGGALALLIAVTAQFTLKGEAGKKAVSIAAHQFGSDYKYFVSSINWSGHQLTARLTVYNDDESKEVVVAWEN